MENTENETISEPNLSENGTKNPADISQESAENVSPDVQDNSLNNVSQDFYTEILVAQQTGNEILGRIYAIQIFLLVLLLCICLYLIIKNNVFRHIG